MPDSAKNGPHHPVQAVFGLNGIDHLRIFRNTSTLMTIPAVQ